MLHSPEFWVLVAFIGFFALAWKPLGRAIAGGLDSRSARIKSDLEEAARLREEARTLLASYERKSRDAMKEAEEILVHARVEAQRMSTQAQAELERSIARREQLALQWIAQAEADALREVRSKAVDLAIAATAKILSEKLDSARADALIDAAIKELPRKLH
jgi:F-type H+-transporting ATPase subunit b